MSVDIVNLIENNPITKLNGNYQSKLIEKVQKNFNNYEQQMFVASFYCYLKHDKKNDFIIDLDDIWKWLGFQQKVKAKVLLEKHFVINKDYKLLLSQPGKQTTVTKGGHNKETFTLNIVTFKKYCLKAGTKKADEIHDYFIKLEEVLQEIVLEESNELKNQLEQQKTNYYQLQDKKKKEYDKKLETQKILEREKILLDKYATSGAIFYVIKVKTFENGHYIVKIGESSKGILGRYKEHTNKYDECLLLDCFSVQKSRDFETFIKGHELIKGSRVTDLPYHETELELFLIGKTLSYQILLNIINNNIKYFNDNDNGKLELEIEQLKLLLEMKNSNNDNILIQESIHLVKQLFCKIECLEKSNKEILEKLNAMQTKTTTNFNQQLVTLGPRLQQINPETMTINKVYESIAECLKEYNFKVKRPSIVKAIDENTIYHGYRWAFVDRNADPNIIAEIEETKLTKVQNVGYIAKLNSEKSEIITVYLDRKTAAVKNNYISISALDNPVKNYTLTKGNYYILYDKCSNHLKEKFIQKYGEPILYKNGVGQYTSENQLIQEFICKYDCIKQLKISDKTLAKALNKEVLYSNHYFRTLGEKLSIGE